MGNVIYVSASLAFLIGMYITGRALGRKECEQARIWWWLRRKAERNDLLDVAKKEVQQGRFRPQQPDEDLWGYAIEAQKYIDDLLENIPTRDAMWTVPYVQAPKRLLKIPRLPRMPRMPGFPSLMTPAMPSLSPFVSGKSESQFWASIQTYTWVVEWGGLLHRGAKLRHDDAETPVLMCDTSVRVPDADLVQCVRGREPMLTCLRCFCLDRT